MSKPIPARAFVSATLSVAVAAAAELPAEFSAVAQALAAAQRVHTAVPVLTGTEGLDIESVRLQFGARGELVFPGYDTAQGILAGIASTTTGSSRLAALEIGLTALEYNWFQVTLAGDQDRADKLAAEIRSLMAVYDQIADDLVSPAILVPFANPYYTRAEGARLVMALRRMAGSAIFRMLIPQVADPEGYLRQRMSATRARLTNTADLIMDAAAAHAYY